MTHNKLFIATLIATAALAGCSGSDEGDDVDISIISDGSGSGSGGSSGTGDCTDIVAADFVSCDSNTGNATLSGTIDEDYTLTSDREWRLDGEVLVGNGNVAISSQAEKDAILAAGVTLTIEAGTDIRAFDTGSLLVTRGSKLMADGSASEPITFSSVGDADFDGYGEWGGVIIQGFAPQYGAGNTGACFSGSDTWCNVEGEGGTVVGRYGGSDEDDNSGVLRFVRIAEGGLVAGPNNEINGLTLQGVGHGTTIEYIQVHNNLDDGVEWFGGTVNVKYLVLTNNDDDDIDFDEGYKGNIQYALIQKDPNKTSPTGSNDPRGIEANSSDEDYVPQTEGVLANITIVGSAVNNDADSDSGAQPGMRLRGSLTTAIYNSSVDNFDTGCIRIDDSDIDGMGTIVASNVTLENILTDCRDGSYDKRDADLQTNIVETGLSYSPTYAINEAAAVLSAAPTIVAVNNGSGFTFDQTTYVGAVDPAAASGWWEGWIIPGSLGSAEPVAADFVRCDDAALVCTVEGTIDEDYTFVRGYEWRLDGEVLVGSGNIAIASQAEKDAVIAAGVTLTIDAGVQVRAFDDGSLLVTRGSKLMAIGTAASPITFSSVQDEDFDGEGEWGGVVVQGFAPQYGQGGTGACFGANTWCNVEGEGGTVIGRFGGSDVDDNSGVIKYVRIAEGGLVAGPNNEINGLTLQGVGYGTVIDYVQVHNNLDDGVEWFGGTVNATHLVLTNNDDDDIDYDEGYKGNIQYAIIRKNPSKSGPTGNNDPRGIEANSSDDDFVPETEAVIANVLILGSDVNNDATSSQGEQPGMRLRGALTTAIYNTAVKDFDTGCIRIDDADTDGNPATGDADGLEAFSDVTLVNVLGDCEDGFYDKRAADTETNAVVNSVTVGADSAYALTDGAALVGATTITAVNNGSGFTFDQTEYVGAVEPGTDEEDAWWSGWIIDGSL
ncbi:hypothetical protein [Oceanicoccus sp. KOV_DT_Chl]|uniref:hypothetical protein n=1 Tax=Oceanicoccus sp. KOV_DT_Chl TaxID=1904639 RepID=UPI000C7A0C7A|nr:hypothetical protein [Oceanicoccus sp. KOV_DT_Chl]